MRPTGLFQWVCLGAFKLRGVLMAPFIVYMLLHYDGQSERNLLSWIAGAVLFSGCHPQDCHYITGQPVGERRAERMLSAFGKMGMSPGRFRVS